MAQTYGRTKIVTDGLVVCLDGGNYTSYPGTGTAVTDISYVGNNGTATNMTFSTEAGGCFNLDGTDDYINIPDNNTLDFTGAMSAELWLNFDSLGTNDLPLWKTNSYGMAYNATWSGNGANKLGVSIMQAGAWRGAEASATIATDTWYCLVLTFDKPTLKCYLNGGVEETTTTPDLFIGTTTNPLRIGIDGGASSAYAFQGLVGSLKIYNRELTASEVLQNYNSQKARFGL